jgi:hypothetical protein
VSHPSRRVQVASIASKPVNPSVLTVKMRNTTGKIQKGRRATASKVKQLSGRSFFSSSAGSVHRASRTLSMAKVQQEQKEADERHLAAQNRKDSM